MTQNYTELNLLQLIYGECDIFERLEMEHQLEESLTLKYKYDKLYRSYRELPKVKFSPSNSTIMNILHYGEGRLHASC